MRFWTDRASEMYAQIAATAVARREGETDADALLRTAREQMTLAIASADPELACAVLRFCDAHTDRAVEERFAGAIRAMAARRFDVAYACWDDDGRVFSDGSDDPHLPDGRFSGSVLRDLCGTIVELQERLRRQTHAEIDGDLCTLLQRLAP